MHIDNLEMGIKEWQSMPRNNAAELEKADKFFDQQLMPMSLEHFLNSQQHIVNENYFSMALTLGTSWQPLALSIALLKPKKILIMGTAETMSLVELLQNFLKLDKDCIQCVVVDRSEPDDIYRAMNYFYECWGSFGKMCVDITGGTKAMASGAAMMAAVLDADIYYVESKYLPVYRRPLPGSEYLKVLSNPRKLVHD